MISRSFVTDHSSLRPHHYNLLSSCLTIRYAHQVSFIGGPVVAETAKTQIASIVALQQDKFRGMVITAQSADLCGSCLHLPMSTTLSRV